ncbi:MAG: Glu-tRNA(Gln) amidotransferase subunit GatE [Syntrophobacteraceae bacterium]|nr:Glu-tRNA(Gln) amidotransferase subunit GatE [Syntrophobacteraceae bacterium]
MDYKVLGLVAGIEIHQQLDTGEKLFCHCPTTLRETSDHNGDFFRYLRATVSEMGEIDRAAQEEMKHDRRFQYFTYDTTCLIENDEEPPAPLNNEALSICLTIAKMFGMTPVPQVHTMRKLVIDGSNTSGFQRTALVAFGGALPNGARIETICLEEEAAQRVKDEVFSLDRLGIPLVEITTSPDMHTPEDVQAVAEYIGMVLRSTGKVKRGLGTIRQDVNISIAHGARVEIKGVQELDLIAEVVRREVMRQQNLLSIRDELKSRSAVAGSSAGVDVIFAPSAHEMYPAGYQTYVNVDKISLPLCGGSRPGHFRGVTTVVAKLFGIIQPHLALFGRKDYQQLAVIRQMTIDLNFPVEIVGMPIVREVDGLAMSSRNAYLSYKERLEALCLKSAIDEVKGSYRQGITSSERLKNLAMQVISSSPTAVIDYVEFCDSTTLAVLDTVDSSTLMALAIMIGKTRLIDNAILGDD